jgi:hypothetical protein
MFCYMADYNELSIELQFIILQKYLNIAILFKVGYEF